MRFPKIQKQILNSAASRGSLEGQNGVNKNHVPNSKSIFRSLTAPVATLSLSFLCLAAVALSGTHGNTPAAVKGKAAPFKNNLSDTATPVNTTVTHSHTIAKTPKLSEDTTVRVSANPISAEKPKPFAVTITENNAIPAATSNSRNNGGYSLLHSNCLDRQITSISKAAPSRAFSGTETTQSIATLGFLPSPMSMLMAPKFGQLGLYGEPLGGGPIGNEPTGEYNISIGPMKFRFSLSGGMMFNDNIGLSTNKESDFFFSLAWGVNGFWEITEFNRLEITFRTLYKKYIKNADLDIFEVTLLPGSESDEDQLKFSVLINNVTLTFYDRISLTSDPFNSPSLSNISEFVRFQNTVGMSALYDLTDVQLSGNYEHGYVRILSPSSFRYLNRSTDQVTGNVKGDIAHWLNLGFMVQYTNTRYQRNDRSNAHTFSYGPTIELEPTDSLKITAEVLRTWMKFADNGLVNSANSDTNTTSLNLRVTHQLNENMQQSFSVARGIRPALGRVSNHLKTTNFNYTYQWFANEQLSITGTYNFNKGIEERSEKFRRQDIRLGAEYKIPPNWAVVIAYTHAIKDSDIEFNDYRRNTFGVNSTYKF